jgi:hypothetical protein
VTGLAQRGDQSSLEFETGVVRSQVNAHPRQFARRSARRTLAPTRQS